MKKLFAILLTVAMLATAALPVFADATAIDGDNATSAENKQDGDYSITVKSQYDGANTTAKDVISLDIEWQAFTFTYTDGKNVYSPESHVTTPGKGTWENTKKSIYIKNHSNVDIKASFKFTPSQGVTTTGTFYTSLMNDYVAITSEEDQNFTLSSALGSSYAPGGWIYFGVSGDGIASNQKLGTVTVKIVKDVWTEVGTEDALRTALGNGGKVKLTDDITLTSNLSIEKDTKLDLNGHILDAQTNTITVRSSLEVYDNSNGANGKITGSSNEVDIQPLIVLYSANLYLYSGTIEDTGTGDTIFNMIGILYLKGGTIRSQGQKAVTSSMGSSLYMDGGTIDASNTSINALNATISGGTVRGNVGGYSQGSRETLTVTGGTFSFDPAAYIDTDNYKVTPNTDGTYTVTTK